MPKRIRMSLRLSDDKRDFPITFVPAEKKHLYAMAEAILDAYRDTIDYEGEDLEQTLDELKRVYKGSYGPLMDEASFLLMEENLVKAGVLVCLYRGEPTITYTFTRKKEQRLGYATLLILKSAQTLYQLGYHSLYLYVTVENSSAVRLFESLGFSEVPLTTVTEINID
ncbi:GNAT family N-acetyltransferase [Proteiniclasticum sp. SCR006]|uniref:GNAT family N-acetyltransferase n=1 Tax=Proteiniclasticum aestuarii TaxID=2817862 RepID=A0A939H5K7_9CLOT|nr:GNAT family N-acetyltransferase [Proteiniclasticum aestuarii]MBO1263556.1 GNAT family N-acetyltransferase [Proteiniclasticum aestuarii]